MKKILSVLLVLVLAVGTTFAGVTLSGSASTEFGYVIKNADKDNWLGFTNDSSVDVTFDAVTSETINEGDVYAGIKASLSFTLTDMPIDADGNTSSFVTVDSLGVDEAYIAGDNWKVSILSANGIPTFATGWEVNPDDEDDVADLVDTYQDSATGVTVTVYDWVVGVGVDVDFDKDAPKNMSGSLKTPEFVLADGMTLQAGGGVTKTAASGKVDLGAGLVFKYATDKLSVSASTDVLVGIPTVKGDKASVDADAAVSVSYAPVTADIYYATDVAMPASVTTYTDRAFVMGTKTENYLSTKVAVDLAAFDVPVALTVAGLDLINTQYFDVEAKGTIDALEITGFGGYQVGGKKWHAGASVAYTIDQVGTLTASTALSGVNDVDSVTASLTLENTTLVSGATLKAGYESGNFIAKEWGKIFASAKIEF